MAAVNWTGMQLQEAPLRVVEETADGWQPVPGHPFARFMRRPSLQYPVETMWAGFALNYILDGNNYFIKLRNRLGKVIGLQWEPWFAVRAMWPSDGSVWISHYEVLRNGMWVRVENDDIIHDRKGIDPYNSRYGLSPVASVMRELLTDSERARYSGLILKHGGMVPYVLSPKEGTSAYEINTEEIKREWEYATTGDNLGRAVVLTGPMDVTSVGVTPDKLLVDKASKIPEERISAVLGIPAIVLGFGAGLERSTFANFKEAREAAYESYMIPLQKSIAADFTFNLLPDFDEAENRIAEHDLSQVRVLQEDRTDLYTRETLAYEKGVKTRGEARAALNLESTPDDDVYFVLAGEEMPTPESVDQPADDQTKAKKLRLVATAKEATDWWTRNAPPDAQGLETPEIVQ
jgi:HK97 family phage portal protein